MLVVETIARIRRDHLVKGVPIKKLARDLRVSKNTIRKVVRGDATSHTYERTIQPMPKLGPWVKELERRLEANERTPRRDRLSLLRIHEDLAALGYAGGYDAVRRYARAWRRRRRLLSPSQAYVPLSFDPGEAYQFDWSHEYARLAGATTRVKAAHMRLCYNRSRAHARAGSRCNWFRSSRARARRWCSSCALRAWTRDAHERSFRFFGGACRRGIYDNMKTAVTTVFTGKKRDYNRRFQAMCSHHLVEPSRVHARGAHDGVHARRWLGEGAGGEAGGRRPGPPVRAYPPGPILHRDQRVVDGPVNRGCQEASAPDDPRQDGMAGVRGGAALPDGVPRPLRRLPCQRGVSLEDLPGALRQQPLQRGGTRRRAAGGRAGLCRSDRHPPGRRDRGRASPLAMSARA